MKRRKLSRKEKELARIRKERALSREEKAKIIGKKIMNWNKPKNKD